MRKLVLYLNGINGLSLGGAAVLKAVGERKIQISKIYACGIGALFANDFAALDGIFVERVEQRFAHLSKSFRLFVDTGDSLFSKFTNAYKLATSVTSKRIKGFVSERFILSRLQNTSKPKMEVIYSATNILKLREVLISTREWRVGLRATMSIIPIFTPCDYRGQKLVSTTSVTAVPGYSKLDDENGFKLFVNTMPPVGQKEPTRTWEVMMRADYLRTIELSERLSKKFDLILDFSKITPQLSDFSRITWNRFQKIASDMVEEILLPALR